MSFDTGHDPVTNLHRESEIFRAVDDGRLPECARFWVNSQCLVRGKARNPRYGWYNEELAKDMGVQVIERESGGGVVYHDEGNLNWSFFLKINGSFLSPTAAFDQASKFVVPALGRLGVKAGFSPPNRIDVSGYKVSGMAARSTVRTLLVHGTLLLNADLDKLNRLCIPPPGCPPVSNLRRWSKNIDEQAVKQKISDILVQSGFSLRAS